MTYQKQKNSNNSSYDPQEVDLINIPDDKLVNLYNKIVEKIDDTNNDLIIQDIEKIYLEAKIRYSYRSASKSSYDIEQIFEGLDAISCQISHSAFSCAEKFLDNKIDFINEILLFFVKHIDHIRAVKAQNLDQVNFIIDYITNNLAGHKNNQTYIFMLNNVREKLCIDLNKKQKRRYKDLDIFATSYLNKQYMNFIQNLACVIKKQEGYIDFIQSTLASKISNYYIPSAVIHSTARSRLIDNQYKKIFNVLKHINLSIIYTPQAKQYLTQIIRKKRIMKSSLYVEKVLSVMIRHASPWQIQKFVDQIDVIKDRFPELACVISKKILSVISKKIGIRNRIYCYLTGKSKIFNEFKKINTGNFNKKTSIKGSKSFTLKKDLEYSK